MVSKANDVNFISMLCIVFVCFVEWMIEQRHGTWSKLVAFSLFSIFPYFKDSGSKQSRDLDK